MNLTVITILEEEVEDSQGLGQGLAHFLVRFSFIKKKIIKSDRIEFFFFCNLKGKSDCWLESSRVLDP